MSISAIRLTAGTHPDTGQTGVGCFMNVIAYLNSEPQITDKSDCVCIVVRPIAIWANDWMRDDERRELLPFVLRAMGSRTVDSAELSRRAWLAVAMAKNMSEIAAATATAARYAAADATRYAATAERYATYAADAAAAAAATADAALPPLDGVARETELRVARLLELQA